MNNKEKTIHRIREFNRFYMPKLGLLGNSYLGSEYSPTEARVIFEIYENDGCTAAYIAQKMNIDKSYLSRIIKAHQKKGYLTRSVSAKDSRAYNLHLTPAGITLAEDFIRQSNQAIRDIISPLNQKDFEDLVKSLDNITAILQKCKE